jgi:capsular polysaccharide biosynthesis protein
MSLLSGEQSTDRRAIVRSALPGVGVVLRRLPWAVVGVLLGLGIAVAIAYVRAPVYESTTYVTVTAKDDSSDSFSTARAAQALSRIATAPEVVSGPLRRAGLPAVADQPRKFVTVQAAPDAPLISVTGAAASPREAQTIAATVADTLTGVRDLGPFQAFTVADPALPSSPKSPWWLLPAGGAGLGLALALVLAAAVPPRRRR